MTIGLAKSIPARRRANKAELAEWFDVSLNAITGWIARGCPVVQRGGVGTPWVFDLLEVAQDQQLLRRIVSPDFTKMRLSLRIRAIGTADGAEMVAKAGKAFGGGGG